MDTRITSKDDFRLFVGKIPGTVSSAEVQKYFAQFGTVKDVLFPKSEKALKIAFITYTSKEALELALEQRHELGGGELNVTTALPKNSRGPVPLYDTKKETRVFVGGIPADTPDGEIEQYFSKFGTVTKVLQPPTSQSSGVLKGYAFVTFTSAQEKFAALTARNHVFKGAEIRVIEAKPKPQSRAPRPSTIGAVSSFFAAAPPPPTPYEFPGATQALPSLPSRDVAEVEENPTRLFVGRLPNDTTKEELREYFGHFGTVTDVFRPPGQPQGSDAKGYAFVTYSNTKELWRALANCPHTFKEVKIEVIEARPKSSMRPGSTKGGSAGVPPSEPRIFVGRIPMDATETEVKTYFSRFGNVVDIFRPKQNGKDGLWFTFVIFESATEVAKVLAEETHILPNRTTPLNVIRARPRVPRDLGTATTAMSAATAPASIYRNYDAQTTAGASMYRGYDPQLQVELQDQFASPYARAGMGAAVVPGASMYGYEVDYDPYGPAASARGSATLTKAHRYVPY